jgi:hypothetical protein
MLLGFEMFVEILATNKDEVRKTKRLTGKYICDEIATIEPASDYYFVHYQVKLQ